MIMDQKLLSPEAMLLAGSIIAVAVWYSRRPAPGGGEARPDAGRPADVADALKIQKDDFVSGNPAAKIVLIEYGDFQCPFCGRFFKTTEQEIKEKYIKSGEAVFVWRDFAFLGEESFRSAEAARCAGEQGKFWEYHDYLFNNQKGENEGAFSDQNQKQASPKKQSFNLGCRNFNFNNGRVFCF